MTKPKTPRLDDLAPAVYNPRDIDESALEALKASLHEFGDIAGITWNRRTGNIVTGHQRLRSLKETHGDDLRMSRGIIRTPDGERFRVRVVDWPIEKEKAANIAANSELIGGAFTEDVALLVDQVLGELPELGETLLLQDLVEALGFAEDEEVSEDPIPEAPAKPVSQAGDLWALGDHLLLCADAQLKKNVGLLFDGGAARLVFTDPPYGISYEHRGGKHERIANDELRDAALVRLLSRALRWANRYSADDAGFYVWHSPTTAADFADALAAAGLDCRQTIVWVKEHFSLGGFDYHNAFEPCFYAGKCGHRPRWVADRRESTVWRVRPVPASRPGGHDEDAPLYDLGTGLKLAAGDACQLVVRPRAPKNQRLRKVHLAEGAAIQIGVSDEGSDAWHVRRDPVNAYQHPTQKPVGLSAIAMANNTLAGEAVYDPFAGSGSTLIAAEQLGRSTRCCELEPAYCDVVVERWQNLTGKKASRKKGVVS